MGVCVCLTDFELDVLTLPDMIHINSQYWVSIYSTCSFIEHKSVVVIVDIN